MEGLIAEGEDYVKAGGDKDVRDAGLIGSAQRVEHYEIAGYGTARTLAMRLGNRSCRKAASYPRRGSRGRSQADRDRRRRSQSRSRRILAPSWLILNFCSPKMP